MEGERSPDLSGSELIADDPKGLDGWAWCPVCGATEFIPLVAQGVEGYGVDLVHAIDRSGPHPILVEVAWATEGLN
jgi:hypothetical protein